MSDEDETQRLLLPAELEHRVIALARATESKPSTVLARLLEHALGDGESLGIAADLPREIVLVKLRDAAHAGGELAGYASALLDGLDDSEFEQGDLVDELADLVDDAGVGRARLVTWLQGQLARDFRGGGNA